MMIRRLETALPPEPPVRFYKIIAVSFLLVTIALLAVVVFITSKKATVVVVAKEDTKHVTVPVQVASQGDGVTSITGAVSSTQFSWSKKYYPSGSKEIEGTAEGDVIIYNKSNTPQTLVVKTQLLSAGGVLFRLKEGTIVPANDQVKVSVYADKAGSSGDIQPTTFTIVKLALDRQKQIYAESKTAMIGGLRKAGILSQQDIDAAKEDYKQKVVDAFSETLPPTTDMAQVVHVLDSQIKSNAQAGQEVSEFTLEGINTMLVVRYLPQDLAKATTAAINKQFDTNAEKVLSTPEGSTVTVSSYDLSKATADLTAEQDLLVTLDPDSPQLAPDNFTGKKKDEIERYVRGLDHVSGAEVTFSPSWMLSAPNSVDRIKVVVKNIN